MLIARLRPRLGLAMRRLRAGQRTDQPRPLLDQDAHRRLVGRRHEQFEERPADDGLRPRLGRLGVGQIELAQAAGWPGDASARPLPAPSAARPPAGAGPIRPPAPRGSPRPTRDSPASGRRAVAVTAREQLVVQASRLPVQPGRPHHKTADSNSPRVVAGSATRSTLCTRVIASTTTRSPRRPSRASTLWENPTFSGACSASQINCSARACLGLKWKSANSPSPGCMATPRIVPMRS